MIKVKTNSDDNTDGENAPPTINTESPGAKPASSQTKVGIP